MPGTIDGMENKLFALRDLANRFKRFGLSIAWLKAEAGAEAERLPCCATFRGNHEFA